MCGKLGSERRAARREAMFTSRVALCGCLPTCYPAWRCVDTHPARVTVFTPLFVSLSAFRQPMLPACFRGADAMCVRIIMALTSISQGLSSHPTRG
ncbi:hypothetical protein BaRGS_00017291 [Batillaria attramentaria]|uniref:Uncharacterized protein n=1 Tax=Batillaria attramentaria TaxID=370345 RepID=A0ABD0KW61_9CAEN